MITISAFSDGHGQIPTDLLKHKVDVCCLIGDLCPNQTRDWVNDGPWQLEWFKKNYIPLIKEIPARYIILIGGNHDGMFSKSCIQDTKNLINQEFNNYDRGSNVIILENESVNIKGYNFWGSPLTFDPNLPRTNWALGKRSEEELWEVFSKIPSNTDILLTHTPPHGVLDAGGYNCLENYGSKALREVYTQKLIKPKLHIWGHCHSYFGACFHMPGQTRFCNTAETVTIHHI